MANRPKHTRLDKTQSKKTPDQDGVSAEDKQLFTDTVGKIAPQDRKRVPPHQRNLGKQNTHQYRRQPGFDDKETDSPIVQLTDHSLLTPVDSDAVIQFAQGGVQTGQLRALKSGQLNIDKIVDLHGLHADAARTQVSVALQAARDHNWRCVQIIHGRAVLGDSKFPILKNHVNNWLRQHPAVLAFHSCPRSMGGSGAVLVLVKRN